MLIKVTASVHLSRSKQHVAVFDVVQAVLDKELSTVKAELEQAHKDSADLKHKLESTAKEAEEASDKKFAQLAKRTQVVCTLMVAHCLQSCFEHTGL